MHRVGLIPFDTRGDATAVMFVTSQTRSRWILPKGKPHDGENHIETCLREGFEEAGVRGTVLADFPLTVVITKQTAKGMQEIPVTYYPFQVSEQSDDWPEQHKRQRHWALVQDVHRVAHREDILQVVKQFERLLPWVKEAQVPNK